MYEFFIGRNFFGISLAVLCVIDAIVMQYKFVTEQQNTVSRYSD